MKPIALHSTRAGASLRTGLLLGVLAAVFGPALLWLLAALLPPDVLGQAAAPWRAAVLLMVVVQGVTGAMLVLHLLARRLEEPLARLTEQAHALAALRPATTLPLRDQAPELQPLARGLDALRERTAQVQGELQAGKAKLRRAATHDALTGLPNRTLLQELFGHEAASARRQARSLALLRIGIDRLQTVNETLGHSVGEELLTGMAHRLAATLRDSDFICRGGGDEFLVLLSGPVGWDRVATAAERLLRCVEEPLQLPRSGQVLGASASLGIAMYPTDGSDFAGLERAASLALQRSRTLGRGLYSFYQPGLDQALRERIDAERELARALERDELTLVYQPMVDAGSGRVLGCEALLRWQHPERGLLAPADFIETARQCRLMADLDAWVLEAACGELAGWLGQGLAPGRLALNLSVQQARNPALSEALRDALDRHALVPAMLELEITEDAFLDDPDGVPRALARWRTLGLGLTVDDFGVGYSSLSQLRRLRPQRLKIDCSLVRGLPHDTEDCALAQAMLAMAAALGIEVLAEGVETAAQRKWLLAHGCALQQGHLHGMPMPAAAFAAWLARSPQPQALA
jgi:diguanylate cyclase (GGDEF)-like protein